MAQAYTRRITAARLDSPGYRPIYTNSSDDTVVIRDLVLGNLHTAAQSVRIYLSSGGVNYDVYRNPTLAPSTTAHVDLRQELIKGEVLNMQVDLGPATALITGYFLSNT